jgi:hypothetical protein
MKGYRFITDDDTSKFCHRVTEALSNGWKLYGEPKMTFDKKRGVMRCGQAVIKSSPKKNIQKKLVYPLYKKPPELSFQGLRILIKAINYSAACFIESFTLPLSKPITLTFTSSPSLTTSVTLATLLSASSEI